MSLVKETLAPVITPVAFRDYLVVHYFRGQTSVMVWGPPGRGKSAAVLQAAHQISVALSSAVYYVLSSARRLGRYDEDFVLGLSALIFSSYPERRNGGYDFLVSLGDGKRTAVRVSEIAESPKKYYSQVVAAFGNSSVQTRRKALAFAEVVRHIYNLMDISMYLPVLASKLKATMPFVVFNDKIELIDYPCFYVFKGRLPDLAALNMKCVEKNSECRRAKSELGCIAVTDKDELYEYIVRQVDLAGLDSGALKDMVGEVEEGRMIFGGMFLHYIDLRLGQLELDDIKGVPSDVEARVLALEGGLEKIKAAKTLWLPPPWITTRGLGVLFFDEINQAREYIQAAAYQIILDRRISTGHSLSPTVMVVAAGNQPEYAPGVARMLPPPLRNRFAPMFHMLSTVRVTPYFNFDLLVEDIYEATYGQQGSSEYQFIEYLRRMGIPTGGMDAWIGDTYRRLENLDPSTRRAIAPENVRKLVVVTPRSLEFLQSNVSMSPESFLEVAVKYSGSSGMHPLMFLIYTILGTLGIPVEDQALSALLGEYIGKFGLSASAYPFLRLLELPKEARIERFNSLIPMLKAVEVMIKVKGGAEASRLILQAAASTILESGVQPKQILDNLREYVVEAAECDNLDDPACLQKIKRNAEGVARKVAVKLVNELLPCDRMKEVAPEFSDNKCDEEDYRNPRILLRDIYVYYLENIIQRIRAAGSRKGSAIA